ncbi:MerR family transcriptional regulator [Labrys sp. La1]|uniref:MerR family transcriptional regulator n=1 Tax=Labrys sp. La1 TaxID=3404917 RepID=UPI003EB7E6C6
MRSVSPDDSHLTAAECARRMNLTVRALRVYERHRLIAPPRTGKNWRLYGAREIARLNEILALKHLGLSLARIASLLAGKQTDLAHLLALQQQSALDMRARAERSLALLAGLRARLAEGAAVTADDLIKLAKESNMADTRSETVAWRRYEQARPRTAIPADRQKLPDYIGHYELREGGLITVVLQDDRLFARVSGQPAFELFAEGEDAFFYKVVPAQVDFSRDAGKVVGLVVHQDGYEHAAQRVDEERARHNEAKLERRIREKIPVLGGEALLRGIIQDHLRGEPDYAGMCEPLAGHAREQAASVHASLARLGALQSLTFKGVSQAGLDIYDAGFDGGDLEWGFALAPDGRLSALYLRPLP